MSASFENILCSRPFTFLVGKTGVPIIVHEAALADQSPALAALIKGGMSEGINGVAKWDDVNKGTFTRFTQFCYTGDYSVPNMVVKASETHPNDGFGIVEEAVPEEPPEEPSEEMPEEPPAPEEIEAPDDDGLIDWSSIYKKGKKEKKKKMRCGGMWSEPMEAKPKSFDSLSYPLLRPRSNFAHTCEPVVNEGSDENISEVLRLHAELYVLAEKWGIDSLKILTLFKLHWTLSGFLIHAKNVHHIADLARYIYWAEVTPDLDSGLDQLRELVCRYIAGNTEVTANNKQFLALMEEGGAFPRDLWKILFE